MDHPLFGHPSDVTVAIERLRRSEQIGAAAVAEAIRGTRLGARGDAFLPIVPSGPLYGSDFDYYNSDITRTWPVSGKFSSDPEKMYRCILEARNAIIAAMKPGASIESLQSVAEPIYDKYG